MRKNTAKTETITGQLIFENNRWIIRGRYPTCILQNSLQSKPDISSNGSEVEAEIIPASKLAIDYHFI